MSMIPAAAEFHLSTRVADLDASTAYYTAFLGVAPKDRTARYATFVAHETCG
jgi:catechol 2,3-dioxygenase-like lactoylglutathione lyase family enzyme